MSDWPKSVLFQKDGTSVTFDSDAELTNWIDAQRNAWASAIPQPIRSQQVNENSFLLDSIERTKTDANLARIGEDYWPANGSLGRFVLRIPNQNVRNYVATEVIRPGAVAANVNQPDMATARSLAYFYLAIGEKFANAEHASELIPQLDEAVVQVERIRKSDIECVERFHALMEQVETDWKNKIDGFETKVALKAPKTFWRDRAASHKKLALANRRQWFWAMVAFVFSIAGAFALNFLYPPQQTFPALLAADAQRFIAFATLLAVGVWWLRQKLRDLRMHEHFSEDAEERATMVETYAALRATGLQDANLEPILNALYRPAISAFREDVGPTMPIDTVTRAIADLASRGRPAG